MASSMQCLAAEPSSERLGGAVERHASGSYYTPRWLAERVVGLVLTPLVEDAFAECRTTVAWRRIRRCLEASVVDPAVGDGIFPECAADFLAAELSKRFRTALRPERGAIANRLHGAIIRRMLFGVDIREAAVAATKERLDRAAARQPGNRRALDRHFLCGNSVQCQSLDPALPSSAATPGWFDWAARFPRVFDRKPSKRGFAAVLGNPPFVDAETMTRNSPELRGSLGRRWTSTRGNWDLFVPFVELSLELARPGGHIGLVLPNKLLSAKYAAGLRRLLRRQRLRSLLDCSAAPAFVGADVYPLVLHVQRVTASAHATIHVVASLDDSGGSTPRAVPHAIVDSLPEQGWHALFDPECIELYGSWRGMVPLGEIADIHGAATVAEAYVMADSIVNLPADAAPATEFARLVNTGTIDRYRHRWGASPCRYLGKSYLNPTVRREELRVRWPRRAEQAATPKLIIGGLGRNLRAVWDCDGALLAGKSTVVVSSQHVDLRLLAAVLNSAWMSRCYRALFGGLTLQGGYLQFTTAHLKSLPFPRLDWSLRHENLAASLCAKVQRIQSCDDDAEFHRIDEAIECVVASWVAASECNEAKSH